MFASGLVGLIPEVVNAVKRMMSTGMVTTSIYRVVCLSRLLGFEAVNNGLVTMNRA